MIDSLGFFYGTNCGSVPVYEYQQKNAFNYVHYKTAKQDM